MRNVRVSRTTFAAFPFAVIGRRQLFNAEFAPLSWLLDDIRILIAAGLVIHKRASILSRATILIFVAITLTVMMAMVREIWSGI
jgi:hypothetical protein